MALSTYCDYLLYRKAETALGIFPPSTPTPHTTPTYSQASYEQELINSYGTGLTENEIKVAEYRTNCLAGFVTGITAGGVHVTGATVDCSTDIATYTNSSGGTFTLDLSCVNSGGSASYWSASSSTDYAIVNSGYTNSLVGIGTNDPLATLHVNGVRGTAPTVISASSSGNSSALRMSGNTGSFISLDTTEDGSTGESNASLNFRSKGSAVWLVGKNHSDATAGPNNFVIATGSNYDNNFVVVVTTGGSQTGTHGTVGINTETPNHDLTVKGNISADTAIYIGDGDGIASGMTYFAPDFNSQYIKFLSGDQTTLIGYNAGESWENTSEGNTMVGHEAGGAATWNSADQNTAVGYNAMTFLSSGDRNTAIGSTAGGSFNTGSDNVAVGTLAGFGVSSDSNNIAIGSSSIYYQTNGSKESNNIAIGYESQYFSQAGFFNTSMGHRALRGTSLLKNLGYGNVAIGYEAITNNDTGDLNTALGYGAMSTLTSGDRNIGVGYGVMTAHTVTGSDNIIIGNDIPLSAAAATHYLSIGDTIFGDLNMGFAGVGLKDATVERPFHISGIATTIPLRINTLTNYEGVAGAQMVLSSPQGDIFTAKTSSILDEGGYWSASSVDGTFIVNSGTSAGGANANKVGIGTLIPYVPLSVSGTVSASTSYTAPDFDSAYIRFYTGDTTTVVGYQAGGTSYAGDNLMTAVGHQALFSSDGSPANNYNTAVGTQAMYTNNAGTNSTAVGFRALYTNAASTQHVAIGSGALFHHTTGNKNVAVGYSSAYYMSGSSSTQNTFVGHSSGPSADSFGTGTITRNVMIGYESGKNSQGAADNVLVGANIGDTNTFSGDKNVILGGGAAASAGDAKRNIIIGYQAADNITTADNCILIADDTDLVPATANRQLNIGGVIHGLDIVGNNLSTNAISIGTGSSITNLSKTFTVSGDTLLLGNVDLKEDTEIIFNTDGNSTTRIYGTSNNLRLDADDDILLYPDDDVKIGVGSTQYAWFYGTEKQFRIDNADADNTALVVSGNSALSGYNHDRIYNTVSYETMAYSTDGDGGGDIITGQPIHSSVSTKGMLCNLYNGNWYITDPTTAIYITGMTGVALTAGDGSGAWEGYKVLLRGFVRVDNALVNDCGSYATTSIGAAVYADPDTTGEYTCAPGQFATNEYAKIVGHIIDVDSSTTSWLLYINPSQDFIKMA
jgi:hypothetical protein